MVRVVMNQMLGALETAKKGLLWYAELPPSKKNGRDYEAILEIDMAIEALRAELDKPEKVPFAWCITSPNNADWCFSATKEGVISNSHLMDNDYIKTDPFPVYVNPNPQNPLTIDEIFQAYMNGQLDYDLHAYQLEALARGIESAHGIHE